MLRVRIDMYLGDEPGTVQRIERLHALAQQHQWTDILSETLVFKAAILRKQGELAKTLVLLEQAHQVCVDSGAEFEAIRTEKQIAFTCHQMGDLDLAWQHYQWVAKALAERSGLLELAETRLLMAHLASDRNELSTAMALVTQSMDAFSEMGNPHIIGSCHNALGDFQRQVGDLEGARREYLLALRLLDDAGCVGEATIVRLNLCLIQLEQGAFQTAKTALEQRLALASGSEKVLYELFSHAFSSWATAGLGLWEEASVHVEETQRLLAITGDVEGDVALALERVGELASEAGETELAMVAADQARELRNQLRR